MKLTRTRGNTWPDKLILINSETGAPANLTGCVIRMTVDHLKAPPDSSTQVYQLDALIINPEGGLITFAPAVEQTDFVGFFFWDMKLTISDGTTITIARGVLEYVESITK